MNEIQHTETMRCTAVGRKASRMPQHSAKSRLSRSTRLCAAFRMRLNSRTIGSETFYYYYLRKSTKTVATMHSRSLFLFAQFVCASADGRRQQLHRCDKIDSNEMKQSSIDRFCFYRRQRSVERRRLDGAAYFA